MQHTRPHTKAAETRERGERARQQRMRAVVHFDKLRIILEFGEFIWALARCLFALGVGCQRACVVVDFDTRFLGWRTGLVVLFALCATAVWQLFAVSSMLLRLLLPQPQRNGMQLYSTPTTLTQHPPHIAHEHRTCMHTYHPHAYIYKIHHLQHCCDGDVRCVACECLRARQRQRWWCVVCFRKLKQNTSASGVRLCARCASARRNINKMRTSSCTNTTSICCKHILPPPKNTLTHTHQHQQSVKMCRNIK